MPAAGSLNGLSVGARFTPVGYGAQSVTIDKGPAFTYTDVRFVATGALEALNANWLRISMNPALGDGGTCYGDSGGPNFPRRRSRRDEHRGRHNDHRRFDVPVD
ncbi:MAG TPA: hypothetical protein VEL02_08825, partial [Jatrophihabitantaceae bacterium]|nr:hypothetical protein [Jatrophihabitantaceae bacterium]